MAKAKAVANPNIAFVKYWGRVDARLNLPANPSLAMNLGALTTATTVEFHPGMTSDAVAIDGQPAEDQAWARVVAHLDIVRMIASTEHKARVVSQNSFPAGTGLASSASGFAALSLAATQAAGLPLNEAALSRLARLGSGSACRSVPGGFTLWDGGSDTASFARQVASPEHWDLRDAIAVVSTQHKAVGSYDGHGLAPSSPLYAARLAAVPALLAAVQTGIANRDLSVMGPSIETDALAMHGVMMTSTPSLLYWQPATVKVLRAVRTWRQDGLSVYFTMDAGPNVHCFCEAVDAVEVSRRLRAVPGVQDVLESGPGPGARLVNYHLF